MCISYMLLQPIKRHVYTTHVTWIECRLIQIHPVHRECALRCKNRLHESTWTGGLNANWLVNRDSLPHSNAMSISTLKLYKLAQDLYTVHTFLSVTLCAEVMMLLSTTVSVSNYVTIYWQQKDINVTLWNTDGKVGS